MPEPRLMTVASAAGVLGCHPETLRRAIRRGHLSCYRFEGCTRISPEHLQAYMDKSLCPARDPEGEKTSSDGMAEFVEEFRRKLHIRSALEKHR